MKRFFASALICLALTSCILLPNNRIMSRGDSALDKGANAFEHADYTLALDLLAPEAHSGNSDAQYMIGLIYLYGLTGDQNSYLAQQNLTEAALNDHYAAQEVLALMYENRFHPLYNPVEAYRWFKLISDRDGRYTDRATALYAFIRSKGLATAANTPPPVVETHNHGIDFNSMFPLR